MNEINVVVVGCGRVGSHLADLLSSEGHRVAVIDKDPKAFRRLSTGFKGIRIQGDALDREILYQAGIQGADALAAATDSDSLNATIAIIAKNKFRVPKLAIRVFDPSDAEIYRRLGILTVSPTEWGASLMKDMLVHPELHSKLTIGSGEVQIIELAVPPALAGRPVEDVNVPREVMTVAVTRQGKAVVPYQGMLLQDGDILTLAVSATAMSRVEELLSH
ncbi:TrkA family potassium uptake protein [Candidatus Bathyarchaeota archaeon]|nr:TrkA family potassium uptake protein [Candidatus Bathyarchaeota archaeon]